MRLILTENYSVRVKDLNKNKLCSCYGQLKLLLHSFEVHCLGRMLIWCIVM